MLNFTEHMKRIIELAEQSLIHVQAEKYEPAFEDLIKIHACVSSAKKQLDDFMCSIHEGKDPADRIEP